MVDDSRERITELEAALKELVAAVNGSVAILHSHTIRKAMFKARAALMEQPHLR